MRLLAGREVALLWALVTLACAGPGVPVRYRSVSMRPPAAALACAVAALERQGFVVQESSSEQGTAVLARRPSPATLGPGDWWRVDGVVSTDDDGRTVLSFLAGAGRGVAGPLTAPPAELQHVVGTASGRCTW
jgi:hypothetical protein